MIKSYPQVKSICIYLSLDKVWICGGLIGVPSLLLLEPTVPRPLFMIYPSLLYLTYTQLTITTHGRTWTDGRNNDIMLANFGTDSIKIKLHISI